MTRDEQLRIARRLGAVAVLVAFAAVAVLVTDHVVAVARAPAQTRRIQGLEDAAKADAGTSAALHDERKLQTAQSLARASRGRVLAWMLLVSGSIVVACGKWYVSLRPLPAPPLQALVAVRFPEARRAQPHGVPATPPPGSGAELDLSFVDELVAQFGRSREAAIPILQAIQSHYRYLPDEALRRVCELTEITPAQIAGTSTFYAHFRRSPVGQYVVRVCHGTACHVSGARQITTSCGGTLRSRPTPTPTRAASSRSTTWPASAAAAWPR